MELRVLVRVYGIWSNQSIFRCPTNKGKAGGQTGGSLFFPPAPETVTKACPLSFLCVRCVLFSLPKEHHQMQARVRSTVQNKKAYTSQERHQSGRAPSSLPSLWAGCASTVRVCTRMPVVHTYALHCTAVQCTDCARGQAARDLFLWCVCAVA